MTGETKAKGLAKDTADIEGPYRYTLTREFGGDETALWIMCNPSTATAETNDPTIRRCIGFTKSWGLGRLVVCNLYAYRATVPAVMWAARKAGADIVGPRNDVAILDAAKGASVIVGAWGAHPEKGRAADVRALLACAGHALKALGFTCSGAPRHPLYLAAEAALAEARETQ